LKEAGYCALLLAYLNGGGWVARSPLVVWILTRMTPVCIMDNPRRIIAWILKYVKEES
jgi:hypothetical protein